MNLFPFETIRPGQKEFLKDTEISINNRKHLVAHVPTGIGKTAAVIAPSLSHVLENGKTIFFSTPKHTQHTIVIDTLQRIKKKSKIDFIAVDFVGKQWTCLHDIRDLDSRDFNEFCKSMKKDERCLYYKNVHKRKLSKIAVSVIDKIKSEPLHSEAIRELCEKNSLCPYEICIEAGKDADVVVCDYFHIFSPSVRQAFFSKLDKSLENSILIIDEAHNLPDRIRKILSYNLTENSLKRAIKEANFLNYEILSDAFRDSARILKNIGKGMVNSEEKYVKREEFINKLAEETGMKYPEFADMAEELGEEVLKIPNRYRSYSNIIAKFLKNWIKEDIGYARILRKDKFLILSYKCLDPSVSSREIFENMHSTVFMSGTLIPLDMYSSVLGLSPDRTILKEYPSPFPKKNRLVIVVPNVTTKYTKRSDLMYQRYARIISNVVREIPGNTAVFFPSYAILENVREHLAEFGLNKHILIEKQEMNKYDRVQLYSRLQNSENKSGGILMGVQAGSFSEGLDYANNLLDGVVIVGLPLNKPDLETKSLIEYYDFRFNRGWDYGYIYPAMNRALQAAGRCIRSETDRGAIILMDDRFMWRNYSKCFPRDFEFIVSEMPEKYVRKFFER